MFIIWGVLYALVFIEFLTICCIIIKNIKYIYLPVVIVLGFIYNIVLDKHILYI